LGALGHRLPALARLRGEAPTEAGDAHKSAAV
jgi:hypothetical protein